MPDATLSGAMRAAANRVGSAITIDAVELGGVRMSKSSAAREPSRRAQQLARYEMVRRTLLLALLVLAAAARAPLPADAAKMPTITVPRSAATLAITSVVFQYFQLSNILVNG